MDLDQVLEDLKRGQTETRLLFTKRDDCSRLHINEMLEMNEKIEASRTAHASFNEVKFVKNLTSSITHSVGNACMATAPQMWFTQCGWKFYHSRYKFEQALPGHWEQICEKCLPSERERLKSV